MKKIALALVALTAATPAFAQDDAPFTGAHASAIVGYDTVDLNIAGLDNPSGVVYGLNVGYDFQAGGVVLGVEAEAADSTSKVEVLGTTVAELGRDLYVGGRIGFTSGSALIYAKAGYTNARLESGGTSGDADGVRVGAGVEYLLSGNIFAKAEYRYSNYEADIERHQAIAGVGIRF